MKRIFPSLLAALPLMAFGHAHLERSSPAKDATVKASPEHVLLVFSEEVALTSVTVKKDGDATATSLAPLPKDEGVALQVALPKLAKGRYTIRYVGVSSDQHETKGSVRFTVSGP